MEVDDDKDEQMHILLAIIIMIKGWMSVNCREIIMPREGSLLSVRRRKERTKKWTKSA